MTKKDPRLQDAETTKKYANARNFNPISVSTMVRDMVRAFFHEYGDTFGNGITYNDDPKYRKIQIDTANNLNSDSPVGAIPRIMISRGQVSSRVSYLSGDLAAVDVLNAKRGEKAVNKRMDMDGSLNFIIEANTEGVCEILAESLRRYLLWTREYIENYFGFQRFADQIVISECLLDTEDKEKFKIQINVPYRVEDRWVVTEFHMKLKKVFMDVIAN